MSFDEFIRTARERAAAAPTAPTLAERLRALRLADDRRAKIEALAESGATEGEREAAQAALERMQHGGNWTDE